MRASFCALTAQDFRSLATVLSGGMENASQDHQQYPFAAHLARGL
jgi:hypothetical protein